jgi:hypothetical protein
MSIRDGIPEGDNNSSAYAAFVNRKYYRDFSYPPSFTVPKPINFWYDKYFYGRLDFNGNSIVLDENYLKRIPSAEEEVYAMNFVADAFEDLYTYYSFAANTGEIFLENTNLLTLQPSDGWSSVNNTYFTYIQSVYNIFAGSFMASDSRDKKLVKFEDFLPLFEQFISNMVPALPFTKTAFIASKFCDPASSGLIIKIDSSDYGSDKINVQDFIDDPNFIFFTRAAQKFGFKVDKNAPFRLVADLGSKEMGEYMLRYPLTPQYYPPPRQLFYTGDVVQMSDMYDDLGWNGPVFGLATGYKFRVNRTEGDIAFLSLLPAVQRGFGGIGDVYIAPEEGQETPKMDPRLLSIIDVGVPFEMLELAPGFEPSENRQNVERLINQYDEDIRIYSQTPKIALDNVFDRYYNYSYLNDFTDLKTLALQFYNSYVVTKPTVVLSSSGCYKRGIKRRAIRRENVTLQQIESKYDDLYWMKLFAKIRAKETETMQTDQEMLSFLNQLSANYNINGPVYTLDFINLITRGSKKPKIMLTPGLDSDNILSELTDAPSRPQDFPDY